MAEPNRIETEHGWLIWDAPTKSWKLEQKESPLLKSIQNVGNQFSAPTYPTMPETKSGEGFLRDLQSAWRSFGGAGTGIPPEQPKMGQILQGIKGQLGPNLTPTQPTTAQSQPTIPAALQAIKDKYMPFQGGIQKKDSMSTEWPQVDTSKVAEILGPMPQVKVNESGTGREPWEMAAEQQQYEGDRRKAMYWGALSSVPGTGTAQADDLMTPQERAHIEDKIGLKLPQGFKRSQFQQTFGRGTAMGMTPYQQSQLELRERGLDLGEQRLAAQKEAREGIDRRFGEKFRRLPPAGQTELESLVSANDQIDSLISKFDQYRSRIGPITGTANGVLQRLGMSSAEVQQLVGELNDAAGTYIKSKAGSRFSDQDLAFFRAGMPSLNQNAEQFMGALQGYKERLTRGANSAKKAYSALGYDADAFDMAVGKYGAEPQVQGATQAQQPQMSTGGLNVPQQGGGVEVQLRDAAGRVKKVTMDPEQAAQYQPPKGWIRIK